VIVTSDNPQADAALDPQMLPALSATTVLKAFRSSVLNVALSIFASETVKDAACIVGSRDGALDGSIDGSLDG